MWLWVSEWAHLGERLIVRSHWLWDLCSWRCKEHLVAIIHSNGLPTGQSIISFYHMTTWSGRSCRFVFLIFKRIFIYNWDDSFIFLRPRTRLRAFHSILLGYGLDQASLEFTKSTRLKNWNRLSKAFVGFQISTQLNALIVIVVFESLDGYWLGRVLDKPITPILLIFLWSDSCSC